MSLTPSLIAAKMSELTIPDAEFSPNLRPIWYRIPIPSGVLRTIQLVVSAMHILLAFQGRCH
jgi:hypothetical protein